MFKKLAVVAVALAIAVPAYASFHFSSGSSLNQDSHLQNNLTQFAATGNIVSGSLTTSHDDHHNSGSGLSVTSGAALNLLSVQSQVNTDSCGCTTGHSSSKVDQDSTLQNNLSQMALTGNFVSGSGTVVSGGASNGATVLSIVNTVGSVE